LRRSVGSTPPWGAWALNLVSISAVFALCVKLRRPRMTTLMLVPYLRVHSTIVALTYVAATYQVLGVCLALASWLLPLARQLTGQ
jgi:hypothetical protein